MKRFISTSLAIVLAVAAAVPASISAAGPKFERSPLGSVVANGWLRDRRPDRLDAFAAVSFGSPSVGPEKLKRITSARR